MTRQDNARRDCYFCSHIYEQGLSAYYCINVSIMDAHFEKTGIKDPYDCPCTEVCEWYFPKSHAYGVIYNEVGEERGLL